jgi:hypothetical protein
MLVRGSQKLHPEFDLAAAREVFSETEMELAGGGIASPYHLYSREKLCELHGVRTGQAYPTDVFVFGKGESPRRDGTKVGGMPYWPANRPWPKTTSGFPCLFFAQINFADSRDLLPDLPGDVLVLLAEEDTDDFFWEPMRIRFEWLSLGLSPVAQFDPTLSVIKSGPFYGVIYRSADYPFDAEGLTHPWRRADGAEKSGIQNCDLVPILSGTKIDGVPYFIQDFGDPPGDFLCQIGSIGAAFDVPYPWVNHASPLGLGFGDRGVLGEKNNVMFGDGGSIYLFREKDGTVTGKFSCY